MKITKTKICVLVAALAIGSSITAFAASGENAAAPAISTEAVQISDKAIDVQIDENAIAATETTAATAVQSMPAAEMTAAIAK